MTKEHWIGWWMLLLWAFVSTGGSVSSGAAFANLSSASTAYDGASASSLAYGAARVLAVGRSQSETDEHRAPFDEFGKFFAPEEGELGAL